MQAWHLHTKFINIPPKNPQSPQLPLPHHRDISRAKQNAVPVWLLCGLFITEVEMKCLIRDNPSCQMNLLEMVLPLYNCMLVDWWCKSA